MSKRKMCPYYFTTYFNGGEIMGHCKKGYGKNCNIDGAVTCPKNTSGKPRCEIVPRKAKPKYKRVKALAFQFIDRNGNKQWTAYPTKVGPFKYYPCTILIEAKYLKGRKG